MPANNLSELFAAIEQQLQESMNHVAEKTKQLESDHVKSDVYKPYKPYLYDRREDDGGLSDIHNMPHKVYSNQNKIILEIENKTTGQYDSSFYTAGLVEYGHQNGYGEYDFPYNRSGTENLFLKPRSFMANTVRELSDSGRHKEWLKDSLRNKGLDVR